MEHFSVEDFDDKIDSLYRLVIVASRRAALVAKPDSRPLVAPRSRKSTVVALEEILDDKVGYRIVDADDEDVVE